MPTRITRYPPPGSATDYKNINIMNEKANNILLGISATIVLISAVFPLLMIEWEWLPYFYAVGVAGMTVCRLTRRYNGKNFRLKRLYRIETVACLALLLSSFFMFRGERDWILWLTVAAMLQLYTSFVIPKEERKEKK